MISTSGSEFTSPSSAAAINFRIQSTWTWNRRFAHADAEGLPFPCACVLVFCGARRQSPHRAIRANSMVPKDGAPSVVAALAQSADGYFWLGSSVGLYRFDGVVFEHHQPQSGVPFPAENVIALLALPNGDI